MTTSTALPATAPANPNGGDPEARLNTPPNAGSDIGPDVRSDADPDTPSQTWEGREPRGPSRTEAPPGNTLTHFDARGEAHMVDVGAKPATHRVATADGVIRMLPATLARIAEGRAAKGDVIAVARIAAIQATKRCADLIPLCHPLPITRVAVEFALEPEAAAGPGVRCTATVESHGRTGVEMEALTAVQVGLLTVYDMCKAVDRGMVIGEVRVLEKRGGKSGDWQAPGPAPAPASTPTPTPTPAAG